MSQPNRSSHPSTHPQTQSLPRFAEAVDRLQTEGFQTQLWLDFKTQRLTFRWVKNGAKWHVTIRGLNHLPAELERVGGQVIRWLHARESGTANEANYAVPET